MNFGDAMMAATRIPLALVKCHMCCEGRTRKSLAVTFGAGASQPLGQINDLLATNSA